MKQQEQIANNLEAENSIIASLFFGDEDINDNIFLELTDKDFYYEINKNLFNYCLTLWKNKKPIDIPSIMELVGNVHGFITDLTSMITSIPSPAAYRTHINILKKNTATRELSNIAKEITDNATQDPYKTRDTAIIKLTGINDNKAENLEHIERVSNETLCYLTDLKNGIKVIDGLKTPWRKLNYYISNFQNGEITIIAARPSVGKSAFVNEIILNSALKDKKNVALFNLEMSKRQIALRMYANIMNKSIYDLMHGEYQNNDLCHAAEKLIESKVYLDINSFNIEQICHICKVQKKRSGLDMVCIDYLQLVGNYILNAGIDMAVYNAQYRDKSIKQIRKDKTLSRQQKHGIIKAKKQIKVRPISPVAVLAGAELAPGRAVGQRHISAKAKIMSGRIMGSILMTVALATIAIMPADNIGWAAIGVYALRLLNLIVSAVSGFYGGVGKARADNVENKAKILFINKFLEKEGIKE